MRSHFCCFSIRSNSLSFILNTTETNKRIGNKRIGMYPFKMLWQAILMATVTVLLTNKNALGATRALAGVLGVSFRRSINRAKS